MNSVLEIRANGDFNSDSVFLTPMPTAGIPSNPPPLKDSARFEFHEDVLSAPSLPDDFFSTSTSSFRVRPRFSGLTRSVLPSLAMSPSVGEKEDLKMDFHRIKINEGAPLPDMKTIKVLPKKKSFSVKPQSPALAPKPTLERVQLRRNSLGATAA